MSFIKKIKSKIEDIKNIDLIKKSALFDSEYYINSYDDIKHSKVEPATHYYYHGWKEGRNPNYLFNSHEYLELHHDVKKIGMCPLLHYIRHGKFEQREFTKNQDFKLYKNISIIDGHNAKLIDTKINICVIFHIFYAKECIEEMNKYIINIPEYIDIYITTNTKEKIEILKSSLINKNIKYLLVNNRGRDTSALLIACKNIVKKYDIFAFLHFKKSNQNDFGDLWRKYLFDNMIGSASCITEIINNFITNNKLGLVFPPLFPYFLNADLWDISNNKKGCEQLLNKKFNIHYSISIKDKFPLGSMFWARTNSVIDIFNAEFSYKDFNEDEKTDGTIRHFIERLWGIIANINGYEYQEVIFCKNYNKISDSSFNKKRIAIFQCQKLGIIEEYSIKSLSKIADYVYIVINSDTLNKKNMPIYDFNHGIMVRKNTGMDFSAWRDAINFLGYDFINLYDELILCNDSCYFPLYNLNEIFYDMDKKKIVIFGAILYIQKNMDFKNIYNLIFMFLKKM